MATDVFPGAVKRPDEPCRSVAAVTPHDTNELAQVSRALYVGGAGDLVVILADDTTAVTFKAVPAGSVLPVRARIVKATGTAATYIVSLV